MVIYDWAWRAAGQPMTFVRLFREAIEVCSPELYQRRAVAQEIIEAAYMNGLIRELTDLFRSNSEAYRVLMRLVAQAFVRAYLRERRAGVVPRVPGVPAGTQALVDEVHAAVDAEYLRASERRRTVAATQVRHCPHCGQRVP